MGIVCTLLQPVLPSMEEELQASVVNPELVDHIEEEDAARIVTPGQKATPKLNWYFLGGRYIWR